MALKKIIDKLEDVAEAFRGEYTEKDGKFVLAVEGEEDTAALRRALDSERRARESLTTEIKAWKASGKTPEEINDLVSAAAKAEEERLTRAGDFEKLKAQMNEKHAEAIKALENKVGLKDNELKSMKSTLEDHLVKAQATAAIAAEKGVPELLLPQVLRSVKVVEENGKYSVKVVNPEDGSPRVNAKGDPLSINDLVGEMKKTEIFGRAFEGSGASGSGMRPNNAGGGSNGGVNKKSDFKSEKERSAFIDAEGLEAYKALPA